MDNTNQIFNNLLALAYTGIGSREEEIKRDLNIYLNRNVQDTKQRSMEYSRFEATLEMFYNLSNEIVDTLKKVYPDKKVNREFIEKMEKIDLL